MTRAFFIYLLCCSAGLCSSAPAEAEYRASSDVLCGVYSTYIALSLAARDVKYHAVRDAFPQHIETRGVSVAQVEQAIERLGFRSLAVRINFETLSKIENAVGIAWAPSREQDHGHFVVVTSNGLGELRVIDPPFDGYSIKQGDFEVDAWTPVVLISGAGDFSEYEVLGAG